MERTPKSKIRQALRALFLRSREHQACLKAANRSCCKCGAKASIAKGREIKVHVHHKMGIEWEFVFQEIYRTLIPHPEQMEVLCLACHDKEHKGIDSPEEVL